MKDYKKYLEEAPKKKHIVFTFGRMNPPSIGHEVVIKKVTQVAKGDEHRIYVSHSQDNKRNPLSYMKKVQFLRKMFPGVNIMFDHKIKNPFDAIDKMIGEGFEKITMVVGSDRVREFNKGVKGYIEQSYNNADLITFRAMSAGKRDPDGEGVVGISASKMRAFARENEFNRFKEALPKALRLMDKKALFNAVRTGLGIKMNEKVENQEGDFIVDDIVMHDMDGSVCVVIGKTSASQLIAEVIEKGGIYSPGEIIKQDRNSFTFLEADDNVQKDPAADAEKKVQKVSLDRLKQKNREREDDLKDRQARDLQKKKEVDRDSTRERERRSDKLKVTRNESLLVKHGNNPAKALSSITPMSVSQAKKFIKGISVDDSFKLFTALNNSDMKTINSMVLSSEDSAHQLEAGTKKTLQAYMKAVPLQKIEIAPHLTREKNNGR